MDYVTIIFFGIGCVAGIAEISHKSVLASILKPIATVLLSTIYFLSIKRINTSSAFANLNFSALVASIIGDVLFIFNQRDVSHWSFAATIFFYILRNAFFSLAYGWNAYKSEIINPLWTKIAAVVPSIVCSVLLYSLIIGRIYNYKELMIVYYTLLSLLSSCAAMRLNHTSFKSWWKSLLAALILNLSDAFFALECFRTEDHQSSSEVLRLLTYYVATYFFVMSALEHLENYKITQHHRIYTVAK